MTGRTLDRAVTGLFWATAVAAVALSFTAVGTSGLWIDELFTRFVVAHDGAARLTLARAMTDTQPPLYYLLLNQWTQRAGTSDAMLRVPSVVCATGALALFAWGTRGVFSVRGRAWATALAATSIFWTDMAVNARNYALCLLIGTGLLVAALAVQRQVAANRRAAWPVAALLLLGLIGSAAHAYMLLVTGGIIGWLVLTLPSWRTRTALVAGGLAIAGAEALFMRVLFRTSLMDLHHLWFDNSRGYLLFAFERVARDGPGGPNIIAMGALGVAASVAWRRHGLARPGVLGTRLALFATLFVIAAGLAISFAVAPSFSERNVLLASPLLWAAAAGLHDAVPWRSERRLSRAGLVALAAVMAVAFSLTVRQRLRLVNEDWRGSARYIASVPGCADAPIPAVLAWRFSVDRPYFRALQQHVFYGRYRADGGARVMVAMPGAFTGEQTEPALERVLAPRLAGQGRCPVLAWGVHEFSPQLMASFAQRIASRTVSGRVSVVSIMGYRRTGFGVIRYPRSWVVLRTGE